MLKMKRRYTLYIAEHIPLHVYNAGHALPLPPPPAPTTTKYLHELNVEIRILVRQYAGEHFILHAFFIIRYSLLQEKEYTCCLFCTLDHSDLRRLEPSGGSGKCEKIKFSKISHIWYHLKGNFLLNNFFNRTLGRM